MNQTSLNNQIVDLNIKKIQTKSLFNVAGLIGNPTLIVSSYILSNVYNNQSRFNVPYHISIKKLSNRFGYCQQTISTAIKDLCRNKYVIVDYPYIKLNINNEIKENNL